ncbi:hypothetical protein ABW21_db0206668 [Orbilia brochopaga]|nr:hypothetical protein ABW21_db0206668 [Drechslerella brochopaga]
MIEIQIRPPTVYTGKNTQPCGPGNNRVCWVPGSNITTGLCGTWLGNDNYCCTYIDNEFKTTNACGSIAGIHDTAFMNFGTPTITAPDTCPDDTETVINKIQGVDDQCCPYMDYDKLDLDFASLWFYKATEEGGLGSNLTGIRCFNLTTQGKVSDDGSSSYSGNKVGSSGGGSGGSGSGSAGKTSSGSALTVTGLLGGALVMLAVVAQLQV